MSTTDQNDILTSHLKEASTRDSDVNNFGDENNQTTTSVNEGNSQESSLLLKPASLSANNSRNQKLSVSFCEGDTVVQHQVAQHQLSIHRQNSLRLSSHKKKQNNDLESRINRM